MTNLHVLPVKPVPEDRVEVAIETRNAVSSLTSLSNRLAGDVGRHWSTPAVMLAAEERLAELAERALNLRRELMTARARREARR